MSEIYIKRYKEVPVSPGEIYRYAGGRAGDDALEGEVSACLLKMEGQLSFSVCYGIFPIERRGEVLSFGFGQTSSRNVHTLLAGCERILLFAATIGAFPDRMLLKYGSLSPLKALVTNAVGSERVESLCDLFTLEMAKELEKEGCFLTPRFSPGYGDLPLDFQRTVFEALNPGRHLGVTLNDSLLMWPCKSVTALAGIGKTEK